MSSRGGGNQELSTDQMALIGLAAVALSVVIARHKSLLAELGGLLRERGLLAPGDALVQIPQLGGLDAGRLLIAAGLVLVAVVVIRVLARARRVRAGR